MGKHDDCIIFGRSPFIDRVDVHRLLPFYHSIGLNKFGHDYCVDASFWFDTYHRAILRRVAGKVAVVKDKSKKVLLPIHTNTRIPRPANSVLYAPRTADVPYTSGLWQDGHIVLAFKYYTVSVAFNWALLQGFRRIYLVGIDHVETETSFGHYGKRRYERTADLTADSHRGLKQFICAGQQAAQVYQCNPAVAHQWDLPYKDIEELYGPPA